MTEPAKKPPSRKSTWSMIQLINRAAENIMQRSCSKTPEAVEGLALKVGEVADIVNVVMPHAFKKVSAFAEAWPSAAAAQARNRRRAVAAALQQDKTGRQKNFNQRSAITSNDMTGVLMSISRTGYQPTPSSKIRIP